MSPLAFIQCVVYAHFSGELDRVRQYSVDNMSPFIATALAMNGTIAFGLNVVSFIANGKVGAVGICVAGESSRFRLLASFADELWNHSECETGADNLVCGDYFRPDDHDNERVWDWADRTWWSVVCKG